MAYDLRIAEYANGQIDALAAYLVERLKNPEAARHFLDELDDVYKRMEENPFQFHRCKDSFLRHGGYREALFSTMRYRVIFRMDGEIVYVVGVFHTLEEYAVKIKKISDNFISE